MKLYFILVMTFFFGLMGFFVFLGTSEILAPFPALVGIIGSIVCAVGIGIDKVKFTS